MWYLRTTYETFLRPLGRAVGRALRWYDRQVAWGWPLPIWTVLIIFIFGMVLIGLKNGWW